MNGTCRRHRKSKASLGRRFKFEVSSGKRGNAMVRASHFTLETANGGGAAVPSKANFRGRPDCDKTVALSHRFWQHGPV